jgi:ribonuclease Y
MTFDLFTGSLALAAGLLLGYLIRQLITFRSATSTEARIKRQLEESKTQAKEILLEAKDKAVKILEDAKNQERERLAILARQEDRLNLQFKKIEQKEAELENNKRDLERQANQIKTLRQEADALKKESETIIEKISGLSREEAKAKLFNQIEEDSKPFRNWKKIALKNLKKKHVK